MLGTTNSIATIWNSLGGKGVRSVLSLQQTKISLAHGLLILPPSSFPQQTRNSKARRIMICCESNRMPQYTARSLPPPDFEFLQTIFSFDEITLINFCIQSTCFLCMALQYERNFYSRIILLGVFYQSACRSGSLNPKHSFLTFSRKRVWGQNPSRGECEAFVYLHDYRMYALPQSQRVESLTLMGCSNKYSTSPQNLGQFPTTCSCATTLNFESSHGLGHTKKTSNLSR